MWQVEVPAIIAICRSSAAGPFGRGRAEHAQRPGMGVDQSDGHPAGGGQAEFRGGLAR